MDFRTVFDTLTAEALNTWIHEGRQEDLFLDFKGVSTSMLSNKDDRRNFAKCLSGFANSAGGLIVWGVDARPNEKGIDAAIGPHHVDDVTLLVSKLNEFTGSFVTPIVDGVQHRGLPVSGSSGFVVTLVPASDCGPHMAQGGEGRYYKRSGSSFYAMEHFDLEDMFGRRRKPSLRLQYRVEAGGRSSGGGSATHHAKLVIALENAGRATAGGPYVSLQIYAPYRVSTNSSPNEGLPRVGHSGSPTLHRFGGTRDRAVHPGTHLDVAAIDLNVNVTNSGGTEQPMPLRAEVEWVADDFPLVRGVIEIAPGDIIASVVARDQLSGTLNGSSDPW